MQKKLASVKADLIGMGRRLIADPYWVENVKNGEEETLRKCISCNIGCAGNRIALNRPIKCTINSDLILEDTYKDLKVNNQTNAVVIGGGSAGFEAV